MLNREEAKEAFAEYTSHYDPENEQIALKIVHTYHVAENAEKIAESLGLQGEDADLAWLTGLLHDYGRFEQVRRYDTFNDRRSVDHAELGADLLFTGGDIRHFVPEDCSEDFLRIAETAIRQHNKYRVVTGLDSRTQMFCDIVRDADKVDIFRIVDTSSYEAVYEKTEDELLGSLLSPEVMAEFYRKKCIERSIRRHPADWVVGHISLAFELVYPQSTRLAAEQGNLEKIMQFPSYRPETKEEFVKIRDFMHDYLRDAVK